MGKTRSKTRTHVKVDPADRVSDGMPRSFIFKAGPVHKAIDQLIRDFRTLFEPYTASRLRETRKNKLKDYVHIAGDLGVSHLLFFSQTTKATYFKIARLPRGPTFHFEVKEFMLGADVRNSQKRPGHLTELLLKDSPLLILNGFDKPADPKQRLLIEMWQNMIPPINTAKISLDRAHRVLLVHYDPKTEMTSLRHFILTTNNHEVSRAVKRLKTQQTASKALPNLANYPDIASYVLDSGNMSESEAEDYWMDTPVAQAKATLKRSHDEDDTKSTTSEQTTKTTSTSAVTAGGLRAIKLKETGPRLDLHLHKIVEGVNEGDTLYENKMLNEDDE